MVEGVGGTLTVMRMGRLGGGEEGTGQVDSTLRDDEDE